MARCHVAGRAGFGLLGTATLTQEQHGLRIVLDVIGAPPGQHGVHLHDATDCAAIDASGVGRHFNPDRTAHGDPRDPAASHAGDLGNISVDAHGNGRLEVVTTRLSLAIGERDVVRRVITIAEARDDFVSQPYGACGPAIACGRILVQ